MHLQIAIRPQGTASFFISIVIVRLSVAIAKLAFSGTLQLFAVMLA